MVKSNKEVYSWYQYELILCIWKKYFKKINPDPDRKDTRSLITPVLIVTSVNLHTYLKKKVFSLFFTYFQIQVSGFYYAAQNFHL